MEGGGCGLGTVIIDSADLLASNVVRLQLFDTIAVVRFKHGTLQ